MQFVQQRYARDCGIAVAAMLADRSYERVRESARRAGLLHTSGTSIDRLVAILERLTRRRWRENWPEEFLPIAECRAVVGAARPVALLIRCPCGCDSSHWIVAERGYVYCPGEERRCLLRRYGRGEWILRRIVSRSR